MGHTMIAIEAMLATGVGIVSGAAVVIWRAGHLVGQFEVAVRKLSETVDELRDDVKGLGRHLHEVDKAGVETRARLESLNGDCDSEDKLT